MYKFMFCFLITIIAVYASKEFPDYTHHADRQQYDGLNFAVGPADCIKPGPICDGCDKRFDCVEIGINEYIVVPLGSCPNGTTCFSGTCTNNPNPGCNTPPSNGYKFKCYQVGLFPDAFDCQKYHLCVPEDIVDPEITTTSYVPTIDSTLDSVSSTVSDVPTTDTTMDLGSSTISVIPTTDSTLDSVSSTVSDVPTTDTTMDFGNSTISVIPTTGSTLETVSSTVSDVPTTESTVDFRSSTTDTSTIQSSTDSGSSILSTITTTESITDSGSSTISVVQSSDITSLFTIFNSDAERLRSVNIVSYEFHCGDGFYFDPRTNLCRKKLVNGVCPSVTGPCKAVGDVGVLASNPALYYVCIYQETSDDDDIFPQILVCHNNLEYDVTTKRCLDPTPISGTGPDGKTCLAAGKFADSSNCNHYNDCPSIGDIAISRACPTRTYFDHKTSDCAQFTCADLEKSGYKTEVAISNELYVFNPHSDVNPFAADECTRPGTVCKDCTNRTECVDIGEDDYLSYPSSPCPAGTTCVNSTGTCTSNPNPSCHIDPPNENYKFECHQVGIFPDPFDCQAYHLCAPTNPDSEGPGPVLVQSLEYTCTGDFYYDSRTTLCRKKLINGTCPDVTAPCKAIGDVGVIAGNPALYYICLSATPPVDGEVFPQIFACLNNFEYNVTTRRCEDPTPISGLDANGMCIAVGNFAIPHPNAPCSNYIECSAVNSTAFQRSCPTRTYFNPKLSNCVEYTCEDLDK